MDRRFERAWQSVEERQQAGEPMTQIMRSLDTPSLIGALAAIGQRDPIVANVLATELLNRSARAPFLGAALASAAFVLAVFVVDFLLTGTLFLVLADTSSRAFALLVVAAAATVGSVLMYALWRGHLPRLSLALHRMRRRRREI